MANTLKSLGRNLMNTTADLLANSDFINRSVGMANSYEDIMFIVQALGREPISLLGKDYLYIFDHVRRNYNMGTNVMDEYDNECPKFTFYKEKPTVRFADPYNDPMNLLDRWSPEVEFGTTTKSKVLLSYAESDDDGLDNNKEIDTAYDVERANPGVAYGAIASFANVLPTCDLLNKTNNNFNHGKYKTLIARFHTKSMDSRDDSDIKQTAISQQYGMSHGRNLLKINKTNENGYDNPYCRVWTYHHQYNQLARAIRPFDVAETQEELESLEQSGEYNTVGFRTVENKDFGFKGGSSRLDKYGVLNYRNGLVNIAPTAKIRDYFEHKEDKQVSIKKCMFSIENLAWKTENIKMDEYDQLGLSPEQKGPLGGRIMWFPPYDLTFSEDVSVNWNQNQFIGRGEKVYTYTDTERRGNLSFTLLIDHPSILDYWTGHKRNGMKNQGVTLAEGNSGGVDNLNNQENTLLRFFAGCEVLTAKPQEFKHREIEPQKTPDPPKPEVDNPPPTEVHKSVDHKKIYCFAFYPNNYSGMDDAPIKGGKRVNAIHYLLNGIGTQRRFNSITKKGEDFAVDMSKNIVVKRNGSEPISGLGGYEVRSKGVSVATEILNSKAAIDKTYETNSETVQYLTDSDGSTYVAYYEGNEFTDLVSQRLTKYSWDRALPSTQAIKNGKINRHWYDYRYYYRVDSNTLSQDLKSPESYLDKKSYGFNSDGIYSEMSKLEDQFNIKFQEENAMLVSLADMYVALEGSTPIFKDNDVSNIVKEIITNNEKYNITKITFHGNASSQGYNKSKQVNERRNKSLAENRGLTFKQWLIDNNFPNIGTAEYKDNNDVQKGGNPSDVDDEITKLWRSAHVVIEYDETKIEEAATAENVTVEKGEDNKPLTDRTTGIPLNKVDRVEVDNGSISNKIATRNSDWLYNSEDGKKIMGQYMSDSLKIGPNGTVERVNMPDPWTYAMQNSERILGKNFTDDNSWNFDNTFLDNKNPGETTAITSGIVERYDNEGEFFELLEKNDPFLHHLITDKIRYFDPAYHSISPEGFNARLTFLHQCTRQGSTVGGSDSQIGNTAYNLAFGRPPICVLRLGDFYYTKIVINSLSIQYEQPQWDLNPEGIGVMPMFAKVSLNFVFLGGSDLAGPISRLQNAVSFNYYANTSVYDNRAEMVQYDEDGNGREVKFMPYLYPTMLRNGREVKKKLTPIIESGPATVAEFNGRTDNLNQGVAGETYNYKQKQVSKPPQKGEIEVTFDNIGKI